MNLQVSYYVYGVKNDAKTEQLLTLAKAKGVLMTLKDLNADPRASMDFQARGHERFPIVVQTGKPAFKFVGGYHAVMAMLEDLPERASSAQELKQSPFQPVVAESSP